MTTSRMVLCVVPLLVTMAPVSVATVRGASREGRLQTHEWSAPVKADARTNPLAVRKDTLAGAERLFRERCAACHGEDARGTRKAPDLRQIHVASNSDGALFWKISSGNARTGMPGFSFLPELQRWQLVQHLRVLQSSKAR